MWHEIPAVTAQVTQQPTERAPLSVKHLACNVPLPVRISFTYIPSYLWEINNTIRRRYRFLIKSGPELNGRLGGSRKKVMEAHRTGLEIFTNARLLSSAGLCAARGEHITSPPVDSRRPFFHAHTCARAAPPHRLYLYLRSPPIIICI